MDTTDPPHRADDPPTADRPDPGGREVLVFTGATAPEGLAVKALLESEGIVVSVRGEAEGPYRVGPLELWVREIDADDARAAIAVARTGAGASPDGEQEDGA